MVNASTVQDDGTDATLARWPASYGTVFGNVAGAITVTAAASTSNQYSAIATDMAGAPLTLDRIDCQIKSSDTGSAPGCSFGFDLPGGDGNRLTWERQGTSWRFLQQTGYGDNYDPSAAVVVAANTYISLAIAVGANASRYGTTSPQAGYVYAFYSTNGGTSWTQVANPQPAPAGITAGAISVSSADANSDGTNVVTVDNINLQAAAATATVPGVPASLTLTRTVVGTTVTVKADWTAPASNGGSAVTGYSIGDGIKTVQLGTVLTYSFVETSNIDYTITLTAKNAVGSGSSIVRTSTASIVNVLPEIGTFSDDFNDNLLNAPWTTIDSAFANQNGVLVFDKNQLNASAKYLLARGVLTGGSFGMEFPVDPATLGLAVGDTIGTIVRSSTDPTQTIRIYYQDGVLHAEYNAGSPDTQAATVPFVYSKHRWVFIGVNQGLVVLSASGTYPASGRVTLNRSGFPAPAWLAIDVQAGRFVVNEKVATPTNSKPSVPRNVIGTAISSSSASIKWDAPASDGGSPITEYLFSRDGSDTVGGGPYTGSTNVPGTQSFTLLQPATKYVFTVLARNSNGDSPVASVTVTTPSDGTTAPNPSGYDWTSHFTSKALVTNDWYLTDPNNPGGAYDAGASNASWNAGSNNALDPFQYFTDASAPAGEYIRLTCRPTPASEAGKDGGAGFIGGTHVTRRTWTAVAGQPGHYIEFAARFPAAGVAVGMWPALWIYSSLRASTGTDNTGAFTAGYKDNGAEIDALEIFGNTGPLLWAAATHPVGGVANQVYKATTDNQWHTWGIFWDALKIEIYYDRKKVGTGLQGDAEAMNNIPMQAIINLTLTNKITWGKEGGGSNFYPGNPNPFYFDVSYVRHWVGLPF